MTLEMQEDHSFDRSHGARGKRMSDNPSLRGLVLRDGCTHTLHRAFQAAVSPRPGEETHWPAPTR